MFVHDSILVIIEFRCAKSVVCSFFFSSFIVSYLRLYYWLWLVSSGVQNCEICSCIFQVSSRNTSALWNEKRRRPKKTETSRTRQRAAGRPKSNTTWKKYVYLPVYLQIDSSFSSARLFAVRLQKFTPDEPSRRFVTFFCLAVPRWERWASRLLPIYGFFFFFKFMSNFRKLRTWSTWGECNAWVTRRARWSWPGKRWKKKPQSLDLVWNRSTSPNSIKYH